ncbi:MAG: hypothetical protein ACYSUI_25330 [Planctomycetota bacterium]|jgi:hypothetical protein
MSYYMGDYYQGDPFLGGLFKKVAGTVRGAVGGFLRGGPVSAITGGVAGAIGARSRLGRPSMTRLPVLRSTAVTRVPGIKGGLQRIVPGGATGLEVLDTIGVRKRRRMNVGNAKALRRAIRRMDGFVGLARKSLKHTNYKLVSKSAGRRSYRKRCD